MDGTSRPRISVDIIKLGVELGRFSKIKLKIGISLDHSSLFRLSSDGLIHCIKIWKRKKGLFSPFGLHHAWTSEQLFSKIYHSNLDFLYFYL